MIRLLLYQFHKTSGASLHNVSQSVAQSMELVRNAFSGPPKIFLIRDSESGAQKFVF